MKTKGATQIHALTRNVASRAAMAALFSITTLLSACGGSGPEYPEVNLTLAHINDHHSNLDPIADQEITVGGVKTRVEMGGMARMGQAFAAYTGRDDVLKLHAGDAITGTSYFTLFKGEADAAMMNAICFDAFTLGNHEFDEGDAGLKLFLDSLASGTCKTPALSSNVRPATGTPLAPRTTTDYFRPYVVRAIKGVMNRPGF